MPLSSSVLPSRDKAETFTGPAAIASDTCGRSSWGREKITEIGCNWVMTTMPSVPAARMILPSSIRRMPVRPSIGEVMLV